MSLPPSSLLSVEDMYAVSRGTNAVWGVDGYEVPKYYEDPKRQMEEREYIANQKNKGKKTKKHVTKRGNYLDDIAKTTKLVPGPNHYKTEYKWLEAKPKNSQTKKSVPKLKGTFLDAISNEYRLKNFPIPGPGAHNLRKSMKEIESQLAELKKKKIFIKDRPNFLCEFEFLSDKTPGPGSYHPRQIKTKLHDNNTEPKDWIKKHQEFNKKQKEKTQEKSLNPNPTMYMTFGKLYEIREEEKKQKTKKLEKLWGTQTRFPDLKKTKSKSLINVPGPGNYDMLSYWKDPKIYYRKKEEKEKFDKKDWQKLVTKGIEKSIYYS